MTYSKFAAGFMQANFYGNYANGTITRGVIHGTVSPCVAGQSKNTAVFFANPNNRSGSAHLTVDPAQAWASVHEENVAYHAPPNEGSIGVELTDPVSGDPARWQDADHQSMLHLAAKIMADICKRYNLPIVKLSAADLLAGKRGICGHVDVSQAWHQTDHTDPGPDFPWTQFIQYVQEEFDRINNPEELTMAQVDDIKAAIKYDGDITRTLVLAKPNPDGSDHDPGHYGLGDVRRDLADIAKRLSALEAK